MNRKIIVCLLTGCLMCIALFAEAQQPKKVPRIGYLLTGNAAESPRDSRDFDWLCASVAT